MKVIWFICASLILHLCLSFGLKYIPITKINPLTQMTEVEFIEQKRTASKGPSRQVVRNPLVPEKIKIENDNTLARFLSEQRVRVQQETQAAQSGMTQNNSNARPDRQNQNQAQPQTEPPVNPEDSIARSTRENANVNPFQLNSPAMPSTVGEKLPTDVRIGSLTALNTDRYLYYTFYARVEELTRFRWESRLRLALASFDRYTLDNKIRGREWVSQYEFWLDSTGKLHSVHLFKESGVTQFDKAAEFAFRDAQFFPNPPKDLVEDDGFIRLKYSFTVSF